jgi:hypothetical protein
MMNPTRPPLYHRFGAPGTDEVDSLLRRFFRAEMPSQWPAAPMVELTPRLRMQPKRHVVRFFRAPARLAVAAAVALLVIGYVSLQTWFPEPQPASSVGHENMMSRDIIPGTKRKHQTPPVQNQQAPAPEKPQPITSFPPLIQPEVMPNNKK